MCEGRVKESSESVRIHSPVINPRNYYILKLLTRMGELVEMVVIVTHLHDHFRAL